LDPCEYSWNMEILCMKIVLTPDILHAPTYTDFFLVYDSHTNFTYGIH
jgi:hypothetical protein